MQELFGIDFGTTNSATVGLRPTGPVNYDENNQPFPSLIAIDRLTGKVVARGRDAWKQRVQLSEKCEIISSPKTFLGTDTTWTIGGRCWTPQDVTTEVFIGLKELVLNKSGRDLLDRAVVSVPVMFTPEKRRLLRLAAESAGVMVTGFISEPTAAVIRNFESMKTRGKIAVFDWGGGTLDISVVNLRGNEVIEINSSGDGTGGDRLDDKIARWAHDRIAANKKSTISFDEMPPRDRDALRVRAEEAKRQLSHDDSAAIFLARYGDFGQVAVMLSAENMMSILAPEIRHVVGILRDAVCKKARMSFEELGCVLMVGGSSKLRGLADAIQEVADCEVIMPDVDADWQVAQGAAMMANNAGTHVLSTAFGVQLSDNTFLTIFPPGTKVNCANNTMQFGMVDNSSHACFNFHLSNVNNTNAIFLSETERIGTMTIPTYGFSNEAISLTSKITEDLFVNVEGVSTHKHTETATWESSKLLFTYSIK